MPPSNPIVISASRRTDIPAFYMPWFMSRIEKQCFEVVNPFNRKTSVVPAATENVHSIVFWSKNFRPFLNQKFGEKLLQKGYNLFFNFTINSDAPFLEPQVPTLNDRLAQLEELCRRFKPAAINWRFDPICHYKIKNEILHNNLQDVDRIAKKAADLGISRCITSLMDDYPKIKKRVSAMTDFTFADPSLDEKKQIILAMETVLAEHKIRLYMCCEKDVINALPDESTVSGSSCIPNNLLRRLYGGNPSLKLDRGQRISAGCGCRVSVDIGSYQHHPCYHNCLFCYANPRPTPGEGAK
jgi:hypothetical protein